MSWDDNALRLARRQQTLTRQTAGAGLLLIPWAFTGPGLLTRVTLPEPPQLAYPARGVGSLWETALRNAGLVSAHRAGRSVLYARTSVAESVLSATCA
ncbi:hypothetical protein ACFW1M_35355 [Streptomyces inhibens]|uniref:hypothetical protein n=1 Tax=Streptomyces inhibens TaxID=2293571 RepID=UPI0036A00BC4